LDTLKGPETVPAEFDTTALVQDRTAFFQLSMTVYQWSDGTYLEDQDQWWLSCLLYSLLKLPTIDHALMSLTKESSATFTYCHSHLTAELKIDFSG
jgi:hypothetical protein